jgi:ABC-type transporter Mla MlaB component
MAWFNAGISLAAGVNLKALLSPIPEAVVSTLMAVVAALQAMDAPNLQSRIDAASAELLTWCEEAQVSGDTVAIQSCSDLLSELEKVEGLINP